MATTTLQRVGSPQKAEDRADTELCKTHFHVLGVWFDLAPMAWRHNWHLWEERTHFQLQCWVPWRLKFFQHTRHENVYCLLTATFLATVYLPPPDLVHKLVMEARRFVLGMAYVPLHRVKTYCLLHEGGLGLKALAPWLLATYAAANLAMYWH